MLSAAVAAGITAAVWAYLAPGLAFSEKLVVTRLHAGFGSRILFITDIHYHGGCHKKKLLEAIIEAVKPDAMLLGGDTLDEFTPRPESVQDLLETLASSCRACYAVTGNHEHACIRMGRLTWSRLIRLFDSSGCPLLLDEEAVLPGGLRLAGLAWRDEPSGYRLASGMRARIIVAHSPDAFNYIDPGRSIIMLSGHTHGGQICLPVNRAIYTNSRFGYRSGMYRRGSAILYVSRGVGEMMPPRLYCQREVVVLD